MLEYYFLQEPDLVNLFIKLIH